MPLIIITGLPSSGKTRSTNELREFLVGRGKKVRIVSENSAIPKAGYKKNEYYADSQKEKMVRADLKSEAIRLLNKEDVTILDAGNYIKGSFRSDSVWKASYGTPERLCFGIGIGTSERALVSSITKISFVHNDQFPKEYFKVT